MKYSKEEFLHIKPNRAFLVHSSHPNCGYYVTITKYINNALFDYSDVKGGSIGVTNWEYILDFDKTYSVYSDKPSNITDIYKE